MQNTEDLQAIREHVDKLIKIFSPGGGLVFSQIHNFQFDLPPEKILAIFDTAKKYKVS